MVLSQPEIKKAVKDGKIVFDPPLEDDQWGEASVDLRLDFSFTALKGIQGIQISVAKGLTGLGRAGFWDTKTLGEHDQLGNREHQILGRDQFVLAMTHERVVVPRNMIALVEGRSTYARVGLSCTKQPHGFSPAGTGKSFSR